MKYLVLLAICVASASAVCRELRPVQDFQPTKYFGKWYEFKKTVHEFEIGNCATANYSQNADGSFKVVHAQTIDNEYVDVVGSATWRGKEGVARFNVSFPTLPRLSPDQVLATDYVNFAVMHVCHPGLGVEQARVLTRSRNPSADVIRAADAVIEQNEMENFGWTTTTQTNCADEE